MNEKKKGGETRLELRPMANEYPVHLQTSASGHAECRTSRLGGWGRRTALKCVCVSRRDCGGLIRLQSQRNKTLGDTRTIWSWRIIDYHPRRIDAQRRHKPGETYVQACALSQSRSRSVWREQASHSIPFVDVLFRNSGNTVCWLLLARLVMLC